MTGEKAYAYLLRCRDGSLYAGWTVDPEARLKAHNSGKGSAYTRSRRPVRLARVEELPTRSAAMKREAELKRMSRREKLTMIHF